MSFSSEPSGSLAASVSALAERAVSQPPGSENQSWAWLVEAILSQVVAHLAAPASLRAFRSVCRHWKAVSDHHLRALAPLALYPRELVSLFPRLQVLELTRCANVRNRDLFVLAASGLPLRCLTVGEDAFKPWVTNKGLVSIGRMTTLRSLALHDCNSVTNNGLAELAGLINLNSLSLRGCKKVTNSGLEILQAHTALTSLNLHGCKRISDRGIAMLTRLPLRALSLGLTRVRDEGMQYLARLTQLTELHFTNEEITDEGVAHLSCLTDLSTLALRNCCDVSGDALLALLPALPRLAHLNLFKNWEFGDDQLARCCVHMLGLRSLDLRGTWVTAAGMGELSQLTGLTRLALAPHVELRPDQMGVVEALTQLRSLTLSCPAYSPALIAAVAKLTGLRELNLSSAVFRDDAAIAALPLQQHVLAAVAQMPGLRALDVSRRAVAPAALRELLAALPRLESLCLHGCPLPADEVAALERGHPHVNVLKRHAALDAAPELATLLGSLSIT